jgi:hypothetical protein
MAIESAYHYADDACIGSFAVGDRNMLDMWTLASTGSIRRRDDHRAITMLVQSQPDSASRTRISIERLCAPARRARRVALELPESRR